MEFLSVEDYRKLNNLSRPEIEQDVVANIKAANAFVTRWLNFTEEDEYFEIYPNRNKYFLSPNVSAVTELRDLDNNLVTGYTFIGNGTIYFPRPPTVGMMVKATATYGTFTTVPDDIKSAVNMLVQYWQKKEYLESRTFGGETSQFTTKTTGIPTHIRSILELYRNI